MTAAFPLRLPPGWRDEGELAGYRVATVGEAMPQSVLLCRPDDGTVPGGITADEMAAVGALGGKWQHVLVLHAERVRCRGGRHADRVLLVGCDAHGHAVSVEHWRYSPGDVLGEAVAVLPMDQYVQWQASVATALRGGRPAAELTRRMNTRLPVEGDLRISVRTGRHAGQGLCRFADGAAVVALPGLPGEQELPTSHLPLLLAALLGLGPRARPQVSGVLIAARANLDRLLASPQVGESEVAQILDVATLPAGWLAALAAVCGAVRRHARLELTLAGVGESALEVVDAGEAGLWAITDPDPAVLTIEADDPAVEPDGDPVCLAPTTPEVVWQWLSRPAG